MLLDEAFDLHYPGIQKPDYVNSSPERCQLEQYVPAMHRWLLPGHGKPPRTVRDVLKYHETQRRIFQGEQLTQPFLKGLKVLCGQTHLLRLRQFFELFPDRFVLGCDNVVEAKIYVGPEQGCELPPDVVRYREAPYEHGDWRSIGITTRMVEDVCYAIQGKIIVICGKVCVHSYQHPAWKHHDPLMVFNLWRGHAFLYTPEAHKLASRLPTRRSICGQNTKPQQILPHTSPLRITYANF